MDATYFKQRNKDNTLRLRELLTELPDFCDEYFTGIETTTTCLTRLNYAYDLRVFFHYLTSEISRFEGISPTEFSIRDLRRVTTTDIEKFISYLSLYTFCGKEYSNDNTGKSRKLSAVRAMFKYFYNKEKLDSDPAAKVSMPKLKEKAIVRLDVNEVVELLDSVEDGFGLTARQKSFHQKTKLRDVAMLTLFLGTGIRISECVGLNVSDVDLENKAFTVTRKGGKQAVLYFGDEVQEALAAYLEERFSDENNPDNEPALFLSLQKKRISTRAVEDLVKKYSRIVTPLKHITPHKLRSTFGTNLYRETGDIYVVAEVLGHNDVNTTKKHYADSSDEIRRNAVKNIVLRETDD